MIEMPEHLPMPINAAGQGPETDPALVVDEICWSCQPAESWPCAKFLQDGD